MKNTTHHMEELKKLSKRQQTTYLERSPPTQWAQSLDDVQLDIRFALRHGVPGCIQVFDLNITFSKETMNLTAFCFEGDIKMKYVLNLHLWGTIDPEESDYETLSTGGLSVTMVKSPKPARWMTLCFDEKPENLQLWHEQHRKWMYRLDEFDGDEIYEYEGWDLENDEDDEEEEAVWNRPIVRKSQMRKSKSQKVEEPVVKKAKKGKKKGKKGKKKGKTQLKKKKMLKKRNDED